MFQQFKQDCLAKKDKSKKGTVDIKIVPLVDLINSLEHYYTTSSCSGRIVIGKPHKSGRKDKFKWLYCSHALASIADIQEAIATCKKGELWFSMEPAILHVVADTMERAMLMLNCARNFGFRKSGIISHNQKKTTMELISTGHIHFPFKVELLDNMFLQYSITMANAKLKKTWLKITKMEEMIKKNKKLFEQHYQSSSYNKDRKSC